MSLKDKVLFVTGASRGIGLAIALRAAADGAKIVIAAKTVEANSKLPGTIYTAAEEIRARGGEALPVPLDVRDEAQVREAIDQAVAKFGGIDILVNNAGAIQLTGTEATEMKRYDLMQSVNVRAVYMLSKYALPYLRRSENGHILNLSPPINLDPGWLSHHVAYTISKYGMSLCTLGMAKEFEAEGIAVNSLWPETAVDTSAVRNLLGGDKTVARSRKPEIVADAAYWIFNQKSREVTGNFFIDSQVLAKSGVTDLSSYSCVAGAALSDLMPDFFIGKAPERLPVPQIVGGAAQGQPRPALAAAGKERIGADQDKAALEGADVIGAYQTFALSCRNSVGMLKLNRPAQVNCLPMAFFEELPGAIRQLEELDCRALIIHGQGKHFCAGIDLSVLGDEGFLKASTLKEKERLQALILRLQAALTSLSEAKFPVLAAVDGYCLGAGLDLVSACDFRFATEKAQFAIEEINVGLMADLGTLQRLPRLMPEGLVRKMAFTGERLSGKRAFDCGFVSELFPDAESMLKAAEECAARMAGKESSAMAASKQALNFNGGHTVSDSLQECARLQALYLRPEVVMENVKRIKMR
ncbi:MAG TPA: SDR family oxidoreductase [Candidatus Obscuribacter sp.]|nr:SDR family oxidoreductase [Candidatus Obscuribacter sp.]